MSFKSYREAAAACAGWIANGIIENAADNDEDPLTYSTDEEVVMLYMADLASEVSKLLPKEVSEQIDS